MTTNSSARRTLHDKARATRYTARLSGRINRADLEVVGNGSLDARSGRVNGNYQLTRFPARLHSRILNSVMVTGYPSVCEEGPCAENPFASGSYSYIRKLNFGARGELTYSADCKEVQERDGGLRLDSYFEIEGAIDIPTLSGTAPIVETWTSLGDERVSGCFQITWLSDAGPVTAIATTNYALPKDAKFPDVVLYRFIELQNNCDLPGLLEIRQRSRLLSDQEIRDLIQQHH
ncbi:hypothetical protein [Bradyrhizobium genosp. A]|uniref:hypothetical protein n=1 Tax=Bradyrhizobium genosp. A TaxID=83626 RepID=UPI003CECE02A